MALADYRKKLGAIRHVIGEVRRGRQPLLTEYPFDMRPRWTEGDGNPHLAKLIAAAEPAYRENLGAIAAMADDIARLRDGELGVTIDWRNIYLPALDGFSVMWAARRAKATFMEVGSGNSTMFARAALTGAKASTKIVSIDPHPRAEIDTLCDEVIRSGLETVDLALFDRLEHGDTLFIDDSHQSFMNSDVTVFMLDVLPRLKPGVLVGVHDIFLPWDYPENWVERAYNEQYLLASWLFAAGDAFELQLANHWIFRKGLHRGLLSRVWAMFDADIAARGPSAFWGVKRA
jgi:hypothetical protein